MGTITALEVQRRRGGRRVNVFVDGQFALSLEASLAAEPRRFGGGGEGMS